MTNDTLQKKSKADLAVDFRSSVTKLESDLRNIANGSTIVAGADDEPILTNSLSVPIKHFFMDGVYVREMTMYKDTIVVGAIHKHLHMCFLLTGKITVVNEEETIDHIAPCFIVSTPGIKRVLYAHEDSMWYNTHKNPNNTENLSELEKDIVAISYKEYEEYIKNK
jgi:hypothetical protein